MGTLTQDKLILARKQFPDTSTDAKALLLALISSNKHPMSIADTTDLKTEEIDTTTIPYVRTIAGKGVKDTFGGRTLRADN